MANIYPFADIKSGDSFEEYQYFDYAALTRELPITEKIYRAAEALLQSERLVKEPYIRYHGIGAYESASAAIEAALTFTKTDEETEAEKEYNNSRRYSYYNYRPTVDPRFAVNALINKNKIKELSCGCFTCSKKTGYGRAYFFPNYGDAKLCEHMVALLIKIGDYIRLNHPGDETDNAGLMLMKGFGRTRAISSGAKNDDENDVKRTVSLVPLFDETYGSIMLSFKIGNDKMYKLKSLAELVQYVAGHEIMPLGKNQQIDFSRETFKDDLSQKLFEMIQRSVNEDRARHEIYRYSYSSESPDDAVLLIGHSLDAFFEIFNGKRIERKKAAKTDSGVMISDDDPKFTLKLLPVYANDNNVRGVSLNGKLPTIRNGADRAYYYDGEKLCRVSPDYAEFVRRMTNDGRDTVINTKIGYKYIARFFSTVLPELSKYAKIQNECRDAVLTELPPEAVFAFYIDADGGIPVCTMKSVYGPVEYNVFDSVTYNMNVVGVRDLEREREVYYAAKNYFPVADADNKQLCCEEESSIYELLESGLSSLMQLGEVNLSESFKRIRIRPRPKFNIGVAVQSDLLELSVESEDISQEDLLLLLNSMKKKKKYFRLKNGDFMKADDEELTEIEAMLDTLHLTPKDFVKGKMKLPLYRALYLDRMLEQNSGVYAERDKNFKNLVKDFKTVNEADFEAPQQLEKVLRNYQKFGFKWLRTVENCHFGGILADDMGLGKTLQIISLLLDAKQRNGAADTGAHGKKRADAKTQESGVSLVVSPASLVYNWKAEFERFAPDLNVCTVTGSLAERADIIKDASKWDVLVTSYDLLKRDIAEYASFTFDYEIIDEAQFIKNHTTAAAKAVKVIKSRHRYALTGTPIENRLSELWSIFDYLMPGFLYGYDTFRKEFENPIAKYKDERIMEQLKHMVAPFILRRLKKDVLKDIPDKLEEVYYAQLSDEQRKIYDGEVVKIRRSLEKGDDKAFDKSKIELLAELTRIRQICCDPHLLFENYDGASAKLDTCMELIKSALEGEHRVLLFSQFTSMLDIIAKELEFENIGFYTITGETKKEQRIQLVNDFNSGTDNVNVFLISLKAGGTGLNLTGADVVIHFDPWWNVAAQNQATDRAHRIGQTKVVSVYKIIAKDTIEEKILKMQETKKSLADNVLSGETGGLVGMSREEIMELLQ